ncbi:MAG: exonuclease [Chloroflexota bacterium]|nr:MAG: exonuclease [Chloroflexota bacterium]
MTRRLDQILVVDVEATCWSGTPPDGEESEIIQIGVCRLDVATGERLEKRSILVKPQRSKVSEFCTQLTGLTQKQVNKGGVTFEKACGALEREFLARKRIWASYGDYDRTIFQRQCAARGVEYPFSASHINIKSLFALVYALPYEVGMTRALEILGRELEGTQHRGDDDAWNIAGIFAALLLRQRV